MAVSVFPQPSAGATGARGQAYRITNGIVGVANTFGSGLFVIKAFSETSTEFTIPTVTLYGSNNAVLGTVTLLDRDAASTSSELSNSINISGTVEFINFTAGNQINGWLEVAVYSGLPTPITVQQITSSQTFTLSATATAFVFGGGGGGSGDGGGGGGSGYVASASFSAGNHSVVIGGGGAASSNGSSSSFGATSANGGVGTSNRNGGAGGSGGGSGTTGAPHGLGGENGANGESQGGNTGGTGSGTQANPAIRRSVRVNGNTFVAGGFYCGGNGGQRTAAGISAGQAAAANTAGGGGGGSIEQGGGAGGSGVIWLRYA